MAAVGYMDPGNRAIHLGAGDPVSELARMADEVGAQMIIVRAHGHSCVSDLVHGTTVNSLRHRTRANILVLQSDEA